jgi:SAM-dependent methyltransferase
MLTWLDAVAAAGVEIHGTDIDADAVAWTNENLPFVEARTNGAMPPISYPDGFFDLIYNHSVFTHIDETFQDAWLAELHRVMRPGGHLVLTVHGEHAFAKFEDAHGDVACLRRAFDASGIIFITEEAWRPYFPEWYGSSYHSTWYVFAHWSRWFRIRAYVPRGALDFQDMVLLERRSEHEDEDPYLRRWRRPDEGEADLAVAAISQAQALVARGADVTSRSRFGALGTLWRRTLRVLLRNYAVHERQVDEVVLRALREQQDRLTRLERRGR